MTRPSPSQAATIRYFDGGPPPAVRVTEATYAACRREGWIETADEFPYHRTTPAGRAAIAGNAR